MAIGSNLRKLRSKTKFSQQEVADMLGLDRSTYINWENETSDVKSQYIPKLADIFGVEIQDLFLDEQKVRISNNTFDIECLYLGGCPKKIGGQAVKRLSAPAVEKNSLSPIKPSS